MELPEEKTICAVVTAYNPDPEFALRLFIVSKQVGKIIIIDNHSEVPHDKTLKDISNKIDLIYNIHNLGVGTALNQGVRFAINYNYKWVLLLDQDTLISENFINEICGCYQMITNNENIGIIGPYYGSKNAISIENKKENNISFTEVKHLITSGSVIPVSLFEKIGFFRDDLFIDYIDIEFCLRARSKGYRIIRINDQMMSHHIGSATIHRLPWKMTGTTNHSPLRRYFMMRNNIIVVKKYFHRYPGWAVSSLFGRVKSTILMVLFEKQKKIKLKFSIMGIFDGILGKVNRIIE